MSFISAIDAGYNCSMTTAEQIDPSLRVLLLEDDEMEHAFVQRSLQNGWHGELSVNHCESVKDICEYLGKRYPDIILLDLNVLDSKGLGTLEKVMANNQSQTPIVVITSMNDKAQAIEALSLGAQDYVIKGEYSPESLSTSIRYALARSHSKKNQKTLNIEDLKIDFIDQQMIYKIDLEWKKEDLTPMEIKLLALFVRNLEKVLSREELREKIWGTGVATTDRIIDTQISRLRTKLEPTLFEVSTIRGVGYRFDRS